MGFMDKLKETANSAKDKAMELANSEAVQNVKNKALEIAESEKVQNAKNKVIDIGGEAINKAGELSEKIKENETVQKVQGNLANTFSMNTNTIEDGKIKTEYSDYMLIEENVDIVFEKIASLANEKYIKLESSNKENKEVTLSFSRKLALDISSMGYKGKIFIVLESVDESRTKVNMLLTLPKSLGINSMKNYDGIISEFSNYLRKTFGEDIFKVSFANSDKVIDVQKLKEYSSLFEESVNAPLWDNDTSSIYLNENITVKVSGMSALDVATKLGVLKEYNSEELPIFVFMTITEGFFITNNTLYYTMRSFEKRVEVSGKVSIDSIGSISVEKKNEEYIIHINNKPTFILAGVFYPSEMTLLQSYFGYYNQNKTEFSENEISDIIKSKINDKLSAKKELFIGDDVVLYATKSTNKDNVEEYLFCFNNKFLLMTLGFGGFGEKEKTILFSDVTSVESAKNVNAFSLSDQMVKNAVNKTGLLIHTERAKTVVDNLRYSDVSRIMSIYEKNK